MFKTKITYSINGDPALAGKEVAEEAKTLSNTKLGMLFTNANMDQRKVLENVRDIWGNKPIIGCTSSTGIITKDKIITNDSFAAMMSFSDDDLIVGVAGSKSGENAREIGKKIARDAISNAGIKRVPSFFYMVASPKEEEDYLKGIQDVIGEVPFFGGSAADNTLEGKWSIFCNDEIFNDGCAVAFFYAKNECKTMFTGSYRETSNVGIITGIEHKRKLLSINNMPALDVYAEWTNKNPDELMGQELFTNSLLNPLGVKDALGNITLVRHPMIGYSDHSMHLNNHLAVGTAIIELETTPDEIIKTNGETIEQLNKKMKTEIDSYFFVQSSGRVTSVSSKSAELLNEIKKFANGKDFLMIFSFGEYGSNEHSALSCGDLMMSFTAFGK